MKRYNKILICLLMIIFLLLIYGIFNSVSAATYNQSIKSAYRDNNNGINEFPSEYKDLLNKLVETTGHDNWKFRMLYTDIDWNEVIDNETVHLRNTVYKGHDIASNLEDIILKNMDFIKGITVHVEPYLNENKNSEN